MDQEMDSAVERQKSRPKTRQGSLIHWLTKPWNVGLIPSARAAYHRSNQDEGLRLGSRPTAVRPATYSRYPRPERKSVRRGSCSHRSAQAHPIYRVSPIILNEHSLLLKARKTLL
jgi:hypothetical protein